MDHAFGAVEPHHLVVLVADDPPVVLAVVRDALAAKLPAAKDNVRPRRRDVFRLCAEEEHDEAPTAAQVRQLVDAFCRGDECGRRAPASLELASPNYREYQEQYYCQAQLPGHNEPCYGCLNTCACLCGRGEATPRAT